MGLLLLGIFGVHQKWFVTLFTETNTSGRNVKWPKMWGGNLRNPGPGISRKKNISILWQSGLLDMFLCYDQRPHSKILKTHPTAAFWSWHSWKFSKMKVFVFLKILFKKNFLFISQWVFRHVSLLFPKKRTQKYSKFTSSIEFWSWHSWKFSKMKVFVFLYFLKIFEVTLL